MNERLGLMERKKWSKVSKQCKALDSSFIVCHFTTLALSTNLQRLTSVRKHSSPYRINVWAEILRPIFLEFDHLFGILRAQSLRILFRALNLVSRDECPMCRSSDILHFCVWLWSLEWVIRLFWHTHWRLTKMNPAQELWRQVASDPFHNLGQHHSQIDINSVWIHRST